MVVTSGSIGAGGGDKNPKQGLSFQDHKSKVKKVTINTAKKKKNKG